ncbi:hypothetical protein CMO83_03355 [Candidatus Woesearchaeota archaeon]|jgi:predicted transcriptional regulator|nr:hypothetical protein [Candidatus Woesearchaeota archaeon]MDP6648084.1 helix-turn-helix domain-containing protein [Candidatus Woesearchaeota archaeon]|tara:strand:+ start:5735 stop:6487 length:753 start_codon:yes stop_codon:yes gene_type:complete
MELKILKDIGLTEGEIKVYVALLELGKSTVGKIIDQSGISQSKVYDVLKRLTGKGLVSYIVEGKIKHYKAAQPKQILDFIDKKEENLRQNKHEFRKILPDLESRQKTGDKKFSAEVFEGNRGLITVFDMSFDESRKGDTVYALGYPPYASKLFDEYWRGYYKKCDKKGIIRKVIYDYETWFLKKRTGRKLSFYKYMPKGVYTPPWIFIFNDKVAIMNVTPEQKVCFLIQNKEVAESYIQYFNLVWKNALS